MAPSTALALVALSLLAALSPSAAQDAAKAASASDTQNAKDLFPLSETDVAILSKYCANGKVDNPNFHPCPIQGACASCSSKCEPRKPYSCNSLEASKTDDCAWGGGPKSSGYGCGKAVILKFAQGDIEGCNKGVGFGSSQGNVDSNGNSQSTYYCAATSTNAAGCCDLCKKYSNGGIDGNEKFKCKSWVLINPNSEKENTKCANGTGGGTGWINQAGDDPAVITPYYGGCGWCYLLPEAQCAPTCSSWGLTSKYLDSNDNKQNIYWALYGRHGCAEGENDPHFTGAEGTRFEFNGLPEQSFCLVTDEKVHINMKMHGYFDDRTVGASILKDGKAVRTWMREIGILWRSADEQRHSLRLVARSGAKQEYGDGFLVLAELDGVALPRMSPGEKLAYPSGLTLNFFGVDKYGPYDMDKYHVSIPGVVELDLKLRLAHPLLQTKADAEAHFNIMFEALQTTSSIHGVIGQTYRPGRTIRALEYRALSALLGHPVAADGNTGLGYLDGTTADYRVPDVLSSDCKFSAFK